MITIFKNTNNRLETIGSPSEGCWVSVVDPTNQEVVQIGGWGIPPDFITHSLDMNERARTERNNGIIFIVLRLPYALGKSAAIPYITVPLVRCTDYLRLKKIDLSCNCSSAPLTNT